MNAFNRFTMSNIEIVLRNGGKIDLKTWQQRYGLPLLSTKIGRHFSYTETRFARDIQRYGKLVVNELLMIVLDEYRERIAEPVHINSFNRDQAKQDELAEQGFRTAKFSPHVFCIAADVDTKDEVDTREKALTMLRVGRDLGIKIRVGFEQYIRANQSFIHVDVCPEYFAPGEPWHHIAHPKQWETTLTW